MIDSREKLSLDLQLFAEKDIKNQSSSSLKRAINKYNKKINEYADKISNPEKYISNWNELDVRQQEELKKHWNKEIFAKGKRLAYFEILNTIKNELELGEQDLKEFGLDIVITKFI